MLIIIGNGFDLNAGLKTDYLSFFAERYKKDYFLDLKELISNFKINGSPSEHQKILNFTSLYNNELFTEISIWDVIFINENFGEKDNEWCNIEGLIYDYLINNKLKRNMTEVTKIPGTYGKSALKSLSYIYSILSSLIFQKKLTFNQIQFYEWLQSQLKIIEEAFINYIRIELKNRKTYLNNAQSIFNKLYIDDYLSPSVISFNYTTPDLVFNDRYSNKKKIDNYTNVHGTIHKDIIFGIDERGLNNYNLKDLSKSKYLFTKTARKVLTVDENNNFELKKDENSIIFYGHSLDVQDYSYFQSIFDFYNIYNSNVKLIFAYTEYSKRKNIKADTAKRVTSLLKEYGTTMDNKDNGSNLLHKLMLENRIKFREIPKLV